MIVIPEVLPQVIEAQVIEASYVFLDSEDARIEGSTEELVMGQPACPGPSEGKGDELRDDLRA